MNKCKDTWDELIRCLVLIRFGQELGTSTQLAQMVASFVDVFVNNISKIL